MNRHRSFFDPAGRYSVRIGIIHKMYDDIMTQQWREVVDTYCTHASARSAKLTYASEETALHLAIYSYLPGQGSMSTTHLQCIKDMVASIPDDEALAVLKLKSNKGDTPLHLAAQLGSVDICRCIFYKLERLNKVHELIGERNDKNETPLFLAAHRCKVDAFRLLHHQVKGREDRIHLCRRARGETILHSALSGEYFELAYEIIHKYPELVNYLNEDGMSPLHILAKKPHVFESSSNLGTFWSIIYRCIEVRTSHNTSTEDDANDDHFSFPENWRTLLDFFNLIRNVVRPIWSFFTNAFERKNDLEKQDSQAECTNCNIQNTQTQEQQWPARGACPVIYHTDIWFLKFIMKIMLIVLGSVHGEISRITKKKEKDAWAVLIMKKLIEEAPHYMYQNAGGEPWRDDPIWENQAFIKLPKTPPEIDGDDGQSQSDKQNDKSDSKKYMVTPLLAAAKMGILEIVEAVLKVFPASIQDADPSEKNVLLLAVENRKVCVFDFLRKQKVPELMWYQVDKYGNSAAHLAAKYDGRQHWHIPGDALQLQGELKWYKYVKDNIPADSYVRYNNEGETAWDVFQETHEELNKKSSIWIIKASESCSVVAVLIATVAFATSAAVPGGVDQGTGYPLLQRKPGFVAFAISSLLALCFSVLSLIFFLAILTSRCQPNDFTNALPRKLLFGLVFLFTSIISVLICFCAGHSFILGDNLNFAAHPIYVVVCLLVTFFAFRQLPLYDLLRTT